jgi:putative membrane protein
MGAADVVPGVSGGTMALILGIYERLLNAIKSFDLVWIRSIFKLDVKTILQRPDFMFLIPLVTGIFSALLFFTRVIPLPQLILTQPELIYGLFFGLILASILVLFSEHKVFGPLQFIMLCVGVVTGYFLVTLVPFDTPSSTLFIFFAGMIAITAMILPGISGSFILLILHKYSTVLGAVADLDFSILVPFALGCVTGITLFSRLLSWLLRQYYYSTLIFIKGILIASLWVIWPYQERIYVVVNEKSRLLSSSPKWPAALDATLMASIACMVAGFVLVMLINYLASRSKTTA